MDIFTLQTLFINAFGDDLTDKVFARSSPPVQGKRERLFGVGIVQEAPDGFYNHLAHQMLSEQLLVQILLQSCMERPDCQRRGPGRGYLARSGAAGPGQGPKGRAGAAAPGKAPRALPRSRRPPATSPQPILAPHRRRRACRGGAGSTP